MNSNITKRQRHAQDAFQAYKDAERAKRDAIERHLNHHGEIYRAVHGKIRRASTEAFPTAEELQRTSTTQGDTHMNLGIILTHKFPTDYRGNISTTHSGWQLGQRYNVIAITQGDGLNGGFIYFTYELQVGKPRLARIPISALSMSDREIAKEARRSIATVKRTILGASLRHAERQLDTIRRQYQGNKRETERLEKELNYQRSKLRAMEEEAVQDYYSKMHRGSKKQPRGAEVSG